MKYTGWFVLFLIIGIFAWPFLIIALLIAILGVASEKKDQSAKHQAEELKLLRKLVKDKKK